MGSQIFLNINKRATQMWKVGSGYITNGKYDKRVMW